MTVNGANSERSSEPVGPAAAPTATLARFVAELRYDDLPERAREATRDLLLDAVGCALAGYESEETPLISDFVRELGQSQESSVIGGEPLSLAGATLLNGYLITAITACDVYRPAHCHMTPEIVPPALAIAERDGLDGKQLLTALAAGFEAAIRVSVGLHYPAFRERGWHSPGVVGPFGAAAATGKLLGLNADQQRMAFGLAGSQSAGTFANWGTPAVKFHQARAALSGLMAGLLAEKGFLASPEILAHPDGGLFKAYTDAPRPAEAVAELGQHWELENVALRLWPTGSRIQVMITALFELIERYDVRPDDVERLRVVVDPDIKAASGSIPRPRGTFEAMLSAHYVSAVVLHDRELWLDQFGPARYNDPALRRFIDERVEVEADPSLPRTSCRVEVRTRDGRDLTVRADAAKGDPNRPVTPEELTKKFRQCAAGRLPTETTERALEMLLRIEEVSDVGELMRLLGRR
jgi:2-methylcitrate dehydratase PrpD